MELLAIGRFARLTGLTVRAVRHYGELGLLEPAYVEPALIVRRRDPLEKLPEVIPAAIDEVHGHMQTVAAAFARPSFVVCPYPDDEGMVDLEIGWPVDGTFPGSGPVEFTTLPACTVLAYMHRGHYQELGRSYRALDSFLEREGLTSSVPPREIYEASPESVPDPADWLTEIQFPIVRDEARIAVLARRAATRRERGSRSG